MTTQSTNIYEFPILPHLRNGIVELKPALTQVPRHCDADISAHFLIITLYDDTLGAEHIFLFFNLMFGN